MSISSTQRSSSRQTIVWSVVLVVAGVAAFLTQKQWMPHASKLVQAIQNKQEPHDDGHGHDHGDDAHDHDDEPAGPADTLKLTQAAWKNLGLEVGTVKASDFVKEISFNAVVVDRPGQSKSLITAPLTGIVKAVYPLEREIVQPGTPLFKLRLTHEDVVKAQSDFLKGLKNLDVIQQELDRLTQIGTSVIAGKRIVAQRYERDKAQAAIEAMRQSLLLHDLDEQQIDNIEQTREVLQSITISTPDYVDNHENVNAEHVYHLHSLNVSRGQAVKHGDSLGELADHGLLYVEGQAFEDDAEQLIDAARDGTKVKAMPVSGSSAGEVLNLRVQSVAAEVDPHSRSLKFYLLLPNQLTDAASSSSPDNQRFVSWKYRPGYRMEVRVPADEQLLNKIVLPADAVAIEGPNAFVFEQNGDNFDRIDVTVLHRDQKTVVLENDGLLVGSSIAMKGAYQMHVALKNASGGAVDPHAGHSH